MLLIRGFNEEKYAKEIKTGKIGFRDLLTTLLYPENNGYRFSDYYEKAIIEAAVEASTFELDLKNTPANIADMLGLIFNPFMPHFYLSYFHILNENSETWLNENFDDNAHFIFAIPKLQEVEGIDAMVHGPNLIGSQMIYLPESGKARTSTMLVKKAGVVALMQNELDACKPYGSANFDVSMALNGVITSVCCEAFARRCSGRFDDSENEFRLIYKTPTPYIPQTGFFEPVEKRPFSVMVDGILYDGTFVNRGIDTPWGYRKSHNMILETKNPMIAAPITTIKQVMEESRNLRILPYFKPISIKHAFSSYGYIGNKEQCRQFISERITGGLD